MERPDYGTLQAKREKQTGDNADRNRQGKVAAGTGAERTRSLVLVQHVFFVDTNNLLGRVFDLGAKRLQGRKIELSLLILIGDLVETVDLVLVGRELLPEGIGQLLFTWQGDVVLFGHQTLCENRLILLVNLGPKFGFTE